MTRETQEYYALLEEACRAADIPTPAIYRQLRELLERLLRTQTADASLQMTDLSARISYVAAKAGLSVREQNRLHTFRLTGNDVLNHRALPTAGQLARDIKTLAFCVQRLTGEDIPPALRRLLPQADATYIVAPPSGQRIRRMRACFLRRDGHYLYVQPAEQLSGHPLRVRYNVPQINEEFADTCRLLWHQAQLNLLDVDVDREGVLTPGFIVLEPDYLVDISTLAECFKEYGHHPANYALLRLQPTGNARPLLLGNIANLFLDEWIHAGDTPPDYLHCMKKVFRQYAVELAACEDLRHPDTEKAFFEDCRRHFEHIRQTVTHTFHTAGHALDRRDAVLEPSYLCEALGLQGRLDYMQRDMSAFIEMKSGKADEYSIRGKIVPKENNRVQMLLYQAVLEYSMDADHRRVQAYLLYTRYPLLYPARPSWAQVRRVMDVRNRIVANEYAIQFRNDTGYTAKRLEELHPDTLNERGLSGVLWSRYLRPAIQNVYDRMHALTPLERSYFLTLYNFVTKELYTSKSGDVNREGCTGAASLWLSTLEEKLESGEILCDLRIRENHAADAHKPCLAFAIAQPSGTGTATLPNFRQGDAIVLYERNRGTDNVTNKLVFKGNIERITPEEISIRLRATQQNAGVLPADSLYAVEHDHMDTTFRSMYQGLSAFLCANAPRRALLLGARPPEFDTAYDPAIAAARDDDFRRITLKACAARDYFLLVGPPGTGKTSRALRSMVETFHAEGKELLLLSYTNRAVDEICKMLAGITPPADFIRVGSELSCDPAYRPYLLENVLAPCRKRHDVQERIARCHIFAGTVATLSTKTDLFRLKRFDVAIVDEATQILEPQLLGLLCLKDGSGRDAIGKFIMVGDHKQLPAVILQPPGQSEVRDPGLRAVGLRNLKDSLFERLYRHASPRCHDMLCRQGRMNPAVAEFPNHAFYGGRLESLGLPHQTDTLELAPCMAGNEFAPILARRIAFLPSQAEPPLQPAKANHSEARLSARLSAAIYQQYAASGTFDPRHTLGIITPYRSQIALIRQEIAALGIAPLNDIPVDTVERFQGSERDVIIYSFCVNHAYQLKFLANLTEEDGVLVDRKLNVALTRARKQLFITGVPRLLRLNPIYARLLDAIAPELQAGQ